MWHLLINILVYILPKLFQFLSLYDLILPDFKLYAQLCNPSLFLPGMM